MACEAPDVNAEIGFFDGFDGKLVGIAYGSLIAFSILFQLARYYYFKKYGKVDSNEQTEESDERNDGGDTANNKKMKNINDSQSISYSPNTRLLDRNKQE
jgi:hypothetical protein